MTSIFVAKLDFGVTKEQLTELFEAYGKVNRVNIPADKETGNPRGFAFVEMFDGAEAEKAIRALDGYEINNRRLAVKVAENRGDQKRPPNKPFNANQRGESNHSEATQNDSEAGNPSSDSNNLEARKKTTKGKKRGFDSDNDRSKKTKMQAHKKSGKNFRYFEDDEPLSDDLFLFDKDEDESTE